MNYTDNFELYLRTDKSASHSTVSAYLSDLRNFINFKDTPEDMTEVAPSHIRAFIAHLTDLGQRRSTIDRAICSLKAFFTYLRDIEKAIEAAPTESIKTSKKERPLPKYISESDVQSILNAAAETNLKEHLIAELFYGSGGRVSEVVSLKVEDVDFNESFLSLFGKGDKERNNPVHEGCVELIKMYMEEYGITSGYLFPNSRDPKRHMSREAVGKMVKRLAVKAGIDPSKVSPHVFRHSFATHMLNNGCDMAQVQELLGHEDIATTRIYARITKTSKKASYMKFHPLASKVL